MHHRSRSHIRRRLLWLHAALVLAGALVLGWLSTSGRWQIAAMAAIALGTGWTVAWYANRALGRQIHQLRENADALTRGEVRDRLTQLPEAEFPKLVESLGRMSGQLRDTLEEQDRLRRRLSRSEKLAVIGELAATVAHEVNNPLDGLQSSVRLLQRQVQDTEQRRQLLELMQNGLLRIETIVQRLLAMSRDEPLLLQSVSLTQVVDDAVMFVCPRLNEKGIKLVREFPSPVLLARADRVQLSQALINLLLNAADAMNRGGTLTLRCRPSESPEMFCLEVVDTGSGIPPEHLPMVFEPFFTTKGRERGTGLGLSVVKRIVTAHQGTIQVESEPGRGTCFRLHLLLAGQPDASEQEHGTSEKEELGTTTAVTPSHSGEIHG